MAVWTWRGLLRGVVTTRYPVSTSRDQWASELPSPPRVVVAELVTEVVERVVAACPNGSLSRQGRTLVLDVGTCTGCGACYRAAPRAVVPSGTFELAAVRRGDLMKRFRVARDAQLHQGDHPEGAQEAE